MAPSGIPNSCGNTRSPTLTGSQRQQLTTGTRAPWRAEGAFLDEGTAHVDPAPEAAVSAALAGPQTTLVMIAPRSEAVLGVGRMVLVADGQLTELVIPEGVAGTSHQTRAGRDFTKS